MVSREELKTLIDNKGEYILIDVREPWEVDAYGAIPTSHNIPLGTLEHALSLTPQEFAEEYGFSLTHKDYVIFYCRSGSRSAKAAQFAKMKGFHAHNYPGSALDWAEIDRNVKKY